MNLRGRSKGESSKRMALCLYWQLATDYWQLLSRPKLARGVHSVEGERPSLSSHTDSPAPCGFIPCPYDCYSGFTGLLMKPSPRNSFPYYPLRSPIGCGFHCAYAGAAWSAGSSSGTVRLVFHPATGSSAQSHCLSITPPPPRPAE